jgi:hypothetical protein
MLAHTQSTRVPDKHNQYAWADAAREMACVSRTNRDRHTFLPFLTLPCQEALQRVEPKTNTVAMPQCQCTGCTQQ